MRVLWFGALDKCSGHSVYGEEALSLQGLVEGVFDN